MQISPALLRFVCLVVHHEYFVRDDEDGRAHDVRLVGELLVEADPTRAVVLARFLFNAENGREKDTTLGGLRPANPEERYLVLLDGAHAALEAAVAAARLLLQLLEDLLLGVSRGRQRGLPRCVNIHSVRI